MRLQDKIGYFSVTCDGKGRVIVKLDDHAWNLMLSNVYGVQDFLVFYPDLFRSMRNDPTGLGAKKILDEMQLKTPYIVVAS